LGVVDIEIFFENGVAICYTGPRAASGRKVENFLHFSKEFSTEATLARCSCGELRVCRGVGVVLDVVDCYTSKNSS
jgi:hypothetical protein